MAKSTSRTKSKAKSKAKLKAKPKAATKPAMQGDVLERIAHALERLAPQRATLAI